MHLLDRMDGALQRKRVRKKLARAGLPDAGLGESGVSQEKDMLKMNIEQQQNYHETKRARIEFWAAQRENGIEQARQKTLRGVVEQRELQLAKIQKWDDFKFRRKAAIEAYIEAKATQRKAEQLLVLVKRGRWISIFAGQFKQYMVRRTKEENMKFYIFRAKFFWRQRRKRLMATDDWDQVYANYARNALGIAGYMTYDQKY